MAVTGGFSDRKVINAVSQAATITATTSGTTIDRLGYGAVVFHVQVGTSTTADGSNYFTVGIEHGDASNMSDAAAVTTATGLLGANLVINATTDANLVNKIGYAGTKRYCRLALTETGTASVQIGATASLEQPAQAPPANLDIAS